MRVFAVSLVLLLSAVAGCVSDPSDPSSVSFSEDPADGTGGSSSAPVTEAPPPADAPETTVETGAVDGLVVDDQALPVANVTVLLLPGNVTTRSDESGKITFNGLAPGYYDLLLSPLGYESQDRRVEVRAGEITEIIITLLQVEILEVYVEPFTFTGHITAGQAFADIITAGLGIPGCDACLQNFTAAADVESVVLELDFTPTVSNPAGKTTLGYQVHDPGTALDPTDAKTYFAAGEWGPRDQIRLDRADFEHLWPDGGNDFQVVHYCSATWVCAEQTFTVYGTFFHNGLPSANFTALPE